MELTVTKEEIKEYMIDKPDLCVENEGAYYKCRVGARSHMQGIFSNKERAERMLVQYVGRLIKKNRIQQAKRKKTNAKKSKS